MKSNWFNTYRKKLDFIFLVHSDADRNINTQWYFCLMMLIYKILAGLLILSFLLS